MCPGHSRHQALTYANPAANPDPEGRARPDAGARSTHPVRSDLPVPEERELTFFKGQLHTGRWQRRVPRITGTIKSVFARGLVSLASDRYVLPEYCIV